MSALDKTEKLLRLKACPLFLLEKNVENPNKMGAREFDLLCDNLNKTGWTDPALVRPLDLELLMKLVVAAGDDDKTLIQLMIENKIVLRIVGGHHRFDAATYLGFEEGPVTIIMDPEFDEEQEQFQLVRMNAIHGKLDPQAFMNLYTQLNAKYAEDILQEAFGFAEEAEFKKLIASTAKALPDKHSQEKFKEAAKEIKTIDGLAKLLNEMFTKYGDTLPYGFMVFDYNGQRSMWLRIEAKTMKAIDVIGDICIENDRTVDDVVGQVMQLIAKGEFKEQLDKAIKSSPAVQMPPGMSVAPTKNNIENMKAVN